MKTVDVYGLLLLLAVVCEHKVREKFKIIHSLFYFINNFTIRAKARESITLNCITHLPQCYLGKVQLGYICLAESTEPESKLEKKVCRIYM